jgi:pilus assembly protein Flp/PilA
MFVSLKEKGQGMVEYALILVLVAVVVIAALTIMGPLVGNVFSTVNSALMLTPVATP